MQLKSLGKISVVTSTITALINSGTVGNKALAASLEGLGTQQKIVTVSQLSLTKAQKIGVLATSGLSAEELKNVSAKITLASAEGATTVALNLSTGAKIANGIATKGVITEESKSLLIKGGLITQKQVQTGATVNLTKAKIADAVATSKLTEAEGKQLITTFGLQGKIGGLGTAFKGLGVSIKKASTSMWTFLTTTPAGWATLAVGAIAALTVGIYAYNKSIDEAVDNAKENLSETESELSEVTTQITETTARIKELEELSKNGQLSITDSEDLEELRKQNEELAIRQKYLEQDVQQKVSDVSDLTKEKYNSSHKSPIDRETIDYYKELYEQSSQSKQSASSYLTGGTSAQSNSYAPGLQADVITKESDSLANLIAQYEYFEQQKKKAIEYEDAQSVDKYNQKLEETAQKLRDDRVELQGFSDDLSAASSKSFSERRYSIFK